MSLSSTSGLCRVVLKTKESRLVISIRWQSLCGLELCHIFTCTCAQTTVLSDFQLEGELVDSTQQIKFTVEFL